VWTYVQQEGHKEGIHEQAAGMAEAGSRTSGCGRQEVASVDAERTGVSPKKSNFHKMFMLSL
jgi:hypothetical protein